MYEAILNLNQQSSGNNAITPLSNSTEAQEGMHISQVNISEIDYHLISNSSLYYTTYGPLYSEESRDDLEKTLEEILTPEGNYPSISNCSNILRSLSEHYNLTGVALQKFLSRHWVEEEGEEINEV